jgi:hypothetical protein
MRHSRLRDRPQRALRHRRRAAAEPNQKIAALHASNSLINLKSEI